MSRENPHGNGYFVISLDFELLWGVFDVVDYSKKIKNFENTLKAIPKILDLFSEYRIHCTWATVGMLFNENWKEWEQNVPVLQPNYDNQRLSAYRFGQSLKSKESERMCFAPDTIKQILAVAGQEIGTHTYSHYYCLESGQEAAHFKSDLMKAIEVAKEFDVKLKSLVFPRNQLKKEYLKICFDLGIRNVRSNPLDWYWKNTLADDIFTKLSRTGDAYIPLGKKSYNIDEVILRKGLPLEQKSSRFLRPLEVNAIFRRLKIKRIKQEMKNAAKNGEVYHIWWHPHNFGDQPEKSLEDLEDILRYFKSLNQRYLFESANMAEIGNIVFKNI